MWDRSKRRLHCITRTLVLIRGTHAQPGVDDEGITKTVEEKVDAFWKGVEGGANKRGEVRP